MKFAGAMSFKRPDLGRKTEMFVKTRDRKGPPASSSGKDDLKFCSDVH